MHPTTLIGSRLAQQGLSDQIRQIERSQGSLVARRRAIELLMASDNRLAVAHINALAG